MIMCILGSTFLSQLLNAGGGKATCIYSCTPTISSAYLRRPRGVALGPQPSLNLQQALQVEEDLGEAPTALRQAMRSSAG